MSETKSASPLFVDTVGGGLAALAAGVAHRLGLAGATAATSSDAVAVPSEVITALAEIGAHVTPVAHLKDVKPAPDQNVGLRLVAVGDRLYDRDIPVAVSGQPLSELFTDEMLRGGYRKKYLRAVSRLVALSRV